LISDGIFEYANDGHELFGVERVTTLIRENRDLPMSELAELIKNSADEFGGDVGQRDDITIVMIRRLPTDEGKVAVAAG